MAKKELIQKFIYEKKIGMPPWIERSKVAQWKPIKKDFLLPIYFQLFERYQMKRPAQTKLEKAAFLKFDTLKKSKKMMEVEKAFKAYKSLSESKKTKFFNKYYLDIPLDKPIDEKTFAQAWVSQALFLVEQYDLTKIWPVVQEKIESEKKRPFKATANIPISGEEFPMLTAPWPVICSINGVKTRSFGPSDVFQPSDFIQIPVFNNNGDLVSMDYKEPPCYEEYNSLLHYKIGEKCLAIPSILGGKSVEIKGFNFTGPSQVILTHLNDPSLKYQIDAIVELDQDTPVVENGKIIADCRVEDKIFFTVPLKTPNGLAPIEPGIYMVDVVVKYPSGCAIEEYPNIVLQELKGTDIARAGYLQVLPAQDLAYTMRVVKGHCYTESSEVLSDELRVRAMLNDFILKEDGTFSTSFAGKTEEYWNNIDQGEDITIDWTLFMNHPIPNFAVLGIIGFEEDSRDASIKGLNSWTDNFIEIMKDIWNLLKDYIDKIKEGIVAALGASAAAIGVFWTAIIVGCVAVLLFAILAIYAWWAGPELAILDFIILDSLFMYKYTKENALLPPDEEKKIDQIEVKIRSHHKVPFGYSEERVYKNPSEDTEYSLFFRVQRVS